MLGFRCEAIQYAILQGHDGGSCEQGFLAHDGKVSILKRGEDDFQFPNSRVIEPF